MDIILTHTYAICVFVDGSLDIFPSASGVGNKYRIEQRILLWKYTSQNSSIILGVCILGHFVFLQEMIRGYYFQFDLIFIIKKVIKSKY